MFEIVFLGTSASAPSVHRGLSSAALLAEDRRFLIDCGEGTQRQILRSGIGFKRLNNVLITHAHLDHVLGLGGLVSTFARWEAMDEINIWGGQSTIDRVRALIHDVVFLGQRPPIPINLHVIQAGVIYDSKGFHVTAFPVIHRGSGCFGFVFQEKARRPFLVEKALELGIGPGPIRGQLVQGETVTLADGSIITPDMVLGEEIAGTKVVFTGDIRETRNLDAVTEGADALVIEGTFLNHEAQLAQQYGHITARQAAILARDTGVKNLLINHISRRYREADVVTEARSIFPTAIVVRDLDHYEVRSGEPVRKKKASHRISPASNSPSTGHD